MARVTAIEGRKGSLVVRLLNWGTHRRLGDELVPLKILAHNPRFLLPYVTMSTFAHGKIQLAPEIRSLAMQLVAELNGCAWCIDFGRVEGQKRGVPAEKLISVLAHASDLRFSPAERAVLAYAEAITQVGARVSDETFNELRRYLTEREIVELTVAIAAENFFNRLNAPLEIEAQGFCSLPVSRPREAANG